MFHFPVPIEGNSGEPVQIIERNSGKYNYHILQYSLSLSSTKKEPFSIVSNEDHTKVFAYMAPRQTMPECEFRSNYQEGDVVEVKEAIEGTMITLFWNEEIESWDVCTRNGVGCNYSFVHKTFDFEPSPKTFRQMIIEAFRIKLFSLSSETKDLQYVREVNDLNDIELLNTLSKSHCYTCILKHPENHLVYSLEPFYAYIRLVAIYETGAMPPLVPVESTQTYVDCIRELENPAFNKDRTIECESELSEDDIVWHTAFKVFGRPDPTTYHITNYDNLLMFENERAKRFAEKVRVGNFEIHSNDLLEDPYSLYYPPAWILTNKRTGHRCEITNPFYELAKSFRNMQPSLRYLYLSLVKAGTLNQYLRTFPRYFAAFSYLNIEYQYFVTEVYNAYVKFYIRKERSEHIPKQYFVHAARIHHNVYMKQEQAPKQKVTRETVYSYFNKFSTTKLLYFLTRQEQEQEQEHESAIETAIEIGDEERGELQESAII